MNIWRFSCLPVYHRVTLKPQVNKQPFKSMDCITLIYIKHYRIMHFKTLVLAVMVSVSHAAPAPVPVPVPISGPMKDSPLKTHFAIVTVCSEKSTLLLFNHQAKIKADIN